MHIDGFLMKRLIYDLSAHLASLQLKCMAHFIFFYITKVKIESSGGDNKTENQKTETQTTKTTETPKTVPMPPKEKLRSVKFHIHLFLCRFSC